MKAIFLKDGKLTISDVSRPVPAEGEALIKVLLAGICNTDIELVKGYMNFTGTIGHEFVGIVEECSDSSLKGKRVNGEINAGCGKCELCLKGDPRHCSSRKVLGIDGLDGAFAEYLALPVSNLLVIPDTVPDTDAVLIEPLAAAFQILAQIEIKKEDKVLIIGDGKLGILVALALQTTGAAINLAGHHAERNKRLLPDINHVELGTDHLKPVSFDAIIEASGSIDGLNDAVKYIKPTGTIVLKSTFHGDAVLNTSLIVVNEIKMIGSRCGRFGPALEALSTGAVKIPSEYIAAKYPLDKGLEAIQYAEGKGVLKVLIEP